MPQIGQFADALAIMNTADITPIEVWRWTPGTIDRGLPTGGAYAQIAFPRPYLVIQGSGAANRELRSDGARERRAIAVISGEALVTSGERPDRVRYAGRWWVASRRTNDWTGIAGYHGALCDLADEPEDEPA